jgi:hypothetical protein
LSRPLWQWNVICTLHNGTEKAIQQFRLLFTDIPANAQVSKWHWAENLGSAATLAAF